MSDSCVVYFLLADQRVVGFCRLCMSQLAKVTKGMLCLGDRRQRRAGLIYLEDKVAY